LLHAAGKDLTQWDLKANIAPPGFHSAGGFDLSAFETNITLVLCQKPLIVPRKCP